MAYWSLSSTPGSVQVLARCIDGSDVVVAVRWSCFRHLAYTRGYEGMAKCAALPFVPRMYWQHLYKEGAVYIGASVREYIRGTPLSEVWHSLDEEARMVIAQDAQAAVRTISSYTAGRFMELQGHNLATANPVKCLNHLIMTSKLFCTLKRDDMSALDMEAFPCIPALAHQNLSLQHIIVSEGRLAGIVGWSCSDYVPEVLERLRYRFACPQHKGEAEWYQLLSRAWYFHREPPPATHRRQDK